jgi:hypothetical protein
MSDFISKVNQDFEFSNKPVEAYLDELNLFLSKELETTDSETRESLCNIVTEHVKSFFDAKGIDNVILEGDIELNPNDYLIHRVNLVYENNDVWVIDLTSKQIPCLKDKNYVVQKLSNTQDNIKKFLKETYNWYLKK